MFRCADVLWGQPVKLNFEKEWHLYVVRDGCVYLSPESHNIAKDHNFFGVPNVKGFGAVTSLDVVQVGLSELVVVDFCLFSRFLLLSLGRT